MAHETDMTNEETRLEALLGQLSPTMPLHNRDKLMFAAGQASVKRGYLWKVTSAVLALLLIGSLLMPALPTDRERTPIIPYIAADGQSVQPLMSPARDLSALTYMPVRHSVLQHGWETLPETHRRDLNYMNQTHRTRMLILKMMTAL